MMMSSSAGMCVHQGQWCWCGDDRVQKGEFNPSSALQLPAFFVWTEPSVGENGVQRLMPIKPYYHSHDAFLSYFWDSLFNHNYKNSYTDGFLILNSSSRHRFLALVF